MKAQRKYPSRAVAPIRGTLRTAPRRGFTLVELLVVMAVTMILIAALAQTFAVIGEMVAEGRATIEISGNIRSVANQLQKDLGSITLPARPWPDAAAAPGYLEIVEGPLSSALKMSTDKNPVGAAQVVDNSTNTIFGDIDDVIAFTARSSDSPYMGQNGVGAGGLPVTIKSSVAEIIWWIQFDDLDGDGLLGPEEKQTIYRKSLLVRPDLGVVLDYSGNNGFSNNPGGLTQMLMVIQTFFNTHDISVRIRCWPDTNGKIALQMTANSLEDLAKRENRFAHLPVLSDRSPTGNPTPPNLLWWFQSSAPSGPAVPRDNPYDGIEFVQYNRNSELIRIIGAAFPMDVNRRSVTSLYRSPKFGANYGEDVMVSDALAFDIQVYDPTAPVRPGDIGEALVPGDPGYFVNWVDQNPTDGTPDDGIGRGAFVDLGYGYQYIDSNNARPARSTSIFSGTPLSKSRLRVPVTHEPLYAYDTWSAYYERNGVDDDNDGRVDEGSNGFDDPVMVNGSPTYQGGVDDVAERETAPPYPVALRGLQIRLRSWDPSSRQVKQATVVTNFVPE